MPLLLFARDRIVRRTGSVLRWVVIGICCLGVLGLVTLLTIGFGAVHGEEFSPNTFQRRSFYYHQIPVLRIQLTALLHTNTTNALETHLTSESLIPALSADAMPIWHLVSVAHGPVAGVEYNPKILCTYLDIQDNSNTFYWLAWSQAQPELAKILWPAIAQVAQANKYTLVPNLFAHAKSETDPAKFQVVIDAELQKIPAQNPASSP